MTPERSLYLVPASAVDAVLDGTDPAFLRGLVRDAYLALANGLAENPIASRIALRPRTPDRAFALPSAKGKVFGSKLVGSVPSNVERGLDRATATIALGDVEDGVPDILVEGSRISLLRTAASAALAAELFAPAFPARPRVGVVGAGPLAAETVGQVAALLPIGLPDVAVYDRDTSRAESFVGKLYEKAASVTVVEDAVDVFEDAPIVIFATSATEPWFRGKTPRLPEDVLVLHLSLRDLDPAHLERAINVVDTDEAREPSTSLGRSLREWSWRTTLDISKISTYLGSAPDRPSKNEAVVFAPYGLGLLDLVLAEYVYKNALGRGLVTEVASFFRKPWRSL